MAKELPCRVCGTMVHIPAKFRRADATSCLCSSDECFEAHYGHKKEPAEKERWSQKLWVQTASALCFFGVFLITIPAWEPPLRAVFSVLPDGSEMQQQRYCNDNYDPLACPNQVE